MSAKLREPDGKGYPYGQVRLQTSVHRFKPTSRHPGNNLGDLLLKSRPAKVSSSRPLRTLTDEMDDMVSSGSFLSRYSFRPFVGVEIDLRQTRNSAKRFQRAKRIATSRRIFRGPMGEGVNFRLDHGERPQETVGVKAEAATRRVFVQQIEGEGKGLLNDPEIGLRS